MVNSFVMEPGYPAPLTAEFMLPVAVYVDARRWPDCGGRQLTWDSPEEFIGLKDFLPLCATQTSVLGVRQCYWNPTCPVLRHTLPAHQLAEIHKLEAWMARLCYVYGHTVSNYTRGFMVRPGFTASKPWAHWLKDLFLKWGFSVEIWEVAWQISEILWLCNVLSLCQQRYSVSLCLQISFDL